MSGSHKILKTLTAPSSATTPPTPVPDAGGTASASDQKGEYKVSSARLARLLKNNDLIARRLLKTEERYECESPDQELCGSPPQEYLPDGWVDLVLHGRIVNKPVKAATLTPSEPTNANGGADQNPLTNLAKGWGRPSSP